MNNSGDIHFRRYAQVKSLASRPSPNSPSIRAGDRIFSLLEQVLSTAVGAPGARVWIDQFPGAGQVNATYALDPTGSTPGAYTTWAALYAAYLLGECSATILLYRTAHVPAGSYTLRNTTTIQGADATHFFPSLILDDGAVLHWASPSVVACQIESQSSAPAIDLGHPSIGTEIQLGFSAGLKASGPSPMIVWTEPSPAELFVSMGNFARLDFGASPVIHIQGAGATNPTVEFDMFSDSTIFTNTVTSNADATAVVFAIDLEVAFIGAQPGYLGVGTPFTNVAAVAGARLDMNSFSLLDALTGQVSFLGGARLGQRNIPGAGVAAGLATDYIVSFADTSAPSSYQAIAMGCPAGQRVALIIQDVSFASAYGVALVNPITVHCLAGKKLNNVVNGTATINTGGGSASFVIDENDNMIQLGGP